jgi:hypothetical protein
MDPDQVIDVIKNNDDATFDSFLNRFDHFNITKPAHTSDTIYVYEKDYRKTSNVDWEELQKEYGKVVIVLPSRRNVEYNYAIGSTIYETIENKKAAQKIAALDRLKTHKETCGQETQRLLQATHCIPIVETANIQVREHKKHEIEAKAMRMVSNELGGILSVAREKKNEAVRELEEAMTKLNQEHHGLVDEFTALYFQRYPNSYLNEANARLDRTRRDTSKYNTGKKKARGANPNVVELDSSP